MNQKNLQSSLREQNLRRKDSYTFLSNHILLCDSHDNTIRWTPGERLQHLYELRCDTLEANHLAVVTDEEELTFQDLDRRANQLARYLIQQGVKPGDRVGLLFNRSVHAYIALLGVLKANAAYVPLDAGFPQDRIAYIAGDSRINLLLTLSDYQPRLVGVVDQIICLDQIKPQIDAQASHRLSLEEQGEVHDELAYIIYTSGSTGNPKGVAIHHASICNFVRVAAEIYGIREDDRIYQGMTLAFDFSVEEIWVPWMAGATLVPGPPDTNLVGQDLADFIVDKGITALCCVPTLLATIDEDIPTLRFLLVSGEACPQDIVRRWYRPDRILLNAYGPTEATVTATLTELYPGKPVTIGGPLPTYYAVILAEGEAQALPKGEIGELCIAGIGLAEGYVNRQDLTDKAFIPDFLNIENNPSGRIYRTGDLARINDHNEIEYLGRIDTQVKIRGYRIELTEIESVLMQVPQIAQAVVTIYEPEPGSVELAAYYTLREDAVNPTTENIVQVLRNHLPAYMVPAYIEEIDVIPMLPSNKADRKSLPAPSKPRCLKVQTDYVAPGNEVEATLAKAFADLMKMEQVSVADDFFQDLGAHSLLMAKFAAQIRKELPDVVLSMRDIYLHPNVRALAAHLQEKPQQQTEKPERTPFHHATTAEYYLCGTLQFLYYIIFYVPLLVVGIEVLNWVLASATMADTFLRVSAATVAFFGLATALPIAAKVLLIGKWKEQKIKIWSLEYFRFWVVKSMIRSSPMILFRGTPIYNVYLRLLGANIGRNVINLSQFMPVCTDLITLGDNTVIQKETVLQGYKAEDGYIHIGPVTVGQNGYIGEGSFLDIHTEMGDNSQLGNTSSLQAHHKIPANKSYHGSPAVETTTNYRRVAPLECSYLRKFMFCLYQITGILLITPLMFVISRYLFPSLYGAQSNLTVLSAAFGGVSLLFFVKLLLLSFALFFSFLLFSLAFVLVVPRLLNQFLKPDKEYVLYGFHYVLFRWVQDITNNQFFKTLFGDSSIKPYYFRWLGWNLGKFKQSGSNFGLQERHDNPFLCEIGVGTMVSDGLSLINADYSSSSFKLSRARVGNNCFIGNDIHYPADAKMGDNCLLASKVMIPIDGPIRENVGILGSPPFEIPRSTFVSSVTPEQLEQLRVERLPSKNKSNVYTLSTFLFVRWLIFYKVLLALSLSVLAYNSFGVLAFAGMALFTTFYFIGFLALVERMSLGFKRMQPKICTIYDPYFWQVEHYWKHCENGLITLFKGTPFKPMISRLLGVRVGKRVFDDGFQTSERTMVEIGDYAVLNEAAFLQSHSLEDGFFKSGCIKIGKECTVGVKAYVHYDTEMKDGSVLNPDSFLMKGEVMEADSMWQGNPARAL